MTWYAYQRGGWQIAVDAVTQRDAAEHIRVYAPGAAFHGEMLPPSRNNESPCMTTAMTTAARQEQISRNVRQG